MSLSICHFRFLTFVLETLKLEWQCTQNLEFNLTYAYCTGEDKLWLSDPVSWLSSPNPTPQIRFNVARPSCTPAQAWSTSFNIQISHEFVLYFYVNFLWMSKLIWDPRTFTALCVGKNSSHKFGFFEINRIIRGIWYLSFDFLM